MRKFVATLSYELGADTPADAQRLLRAELCGRRWRDKCKGRPMPANTVWMERTVGDAETASTVHDACAADLAKAAAHVAGTGLPCRLLRAWVHVSGGGTYGLAGDEQLTVADDV